MLWCGVDITVEIAADYADLWLFAFSMRADCLKAASTALSPLLTVIHPLISNLTVSKYFPHRESFHL